MALDPRNRFLLKTQPDGKRTVLLWTPTLAQKLDMRPITYDEAVQIKKELDGEVEDKKAKSLYPVDIPVDNPVVDEVAQNAQETAIPNQGGEPLVRTNEDLLQTELQKVSKFVDADQLEEYFLLKYHVEILPGELMKMKADAVMTLTELSNANKLYEVGK